MIVSLAEPMAQKERGGSEAGETSHPEEGEICSATESVGADGDGGIDNGGHDNGSHDNGPEASTPPKCEGDSKIDE